MGGRAALRSQMSIFDARVRTWLSVLGIQVAACGSAGEPAHDGGASGGPSSPGSAGTFAAGGALSGAAGSSAGAPASAAAGNGASGQAASSGAGGTQAAAGASNASAGASSAGSNTAGSSSNTAGSGSNTAGSGSNTAGSGSGSAGAPSTASIGAPETAPTGYGQGTTGGGKSKTVSVASFAALQAAIDGYSGSGGLVLEYTGKFDFGSIKDPCVQHTLPAQTIEIKSKSDLSIVGAAGSSANFGFHIAAAASNVIIRNMTIGLLPGGSDSDIISIEGMSAGVPKQIWIDHNELFSSLAECPGAGDTAFDGMIDVKKGADRITVSYNYLHDHHKVSLNGYTDSDDALRQITFHHNLFENVGSRLPLQRHGYAHIVNNLFSQVLTSGINVRMGGYALIEANYFQNVKNPVTARDSSAVGFWELRKNNLASAADVAPGNAYGITWDAGNSGTVNATAWTTTAVYPMALGYTLTAHPAQCVHDGLRAVAGAGKGLATLGCQ